eukprot:EG_transcript_110
MPALYNISQDLKQVFQLGCSMVNSDPDMNASGVSLECSVVCHSLLSNSAANAATTAFQDNALAIVGSLRTTDTIAMSTAASLVGVVSPVSFPADATSQANLLRTSPPAATVLGAVSAVLANFSFWQLAAIGTPQALLPAWTAALNQSGVQFLSVQTLASALDPTAVDAALQAIKDSGASVILAVADPDGYTTIIQRAALLGLTGASQSGTYLWLSVSNVLSSTALQSDPATSQSLQGSLDIRPGTGSGARWDRLVALWRAANPASAAVEDSPPVYAAETLDAVYALAQSIARVKLAGQPVNQGNVLSALRTISFTGASGPLAFSATSSDRVGTAPLSIANLIRWQWVQVGYYNGTTQALSPTAVLWPGGSLTLPVPRLVVQLAGLLPCDPSLASADNSSYLVGLEMCSAFKLACKDLEDQRTFAPGFRIKCTLLAGNGNADTEKALVRSTMDNVIGFVGDRTSSMSIAMQSVLGPRGIPQVGMSSASELSNSTLYPSFFRTVASDAYQAQAVADIVAYFGWPALAIMSTDGAYGRGIAGGVAALLGSAKVYGTFLLPEQVQNQTVVQRQLQAMAATGAKVFFVAAVGDDCLAIMKGAYQLNMTGARWTWLAAGGCVAQHYSVLEGLAGQAMQGILGVSLVEGSGALYQSLAARWATLSEADYPGQVHQGRSPGPRAGVTYDAVYTFANALALLRKWGQARQGMNRTALSQALLQVNFTGTTGVVRFDANGDRVPPVYAVVNLRGYTFQAVGSWQWADSNRLVWDSSRTIAWPGGLLSPPSGRPRTTVTIGALLPIDASLAANSSQLLALGLQVQAAIRIACADMNAGILAPYEVSLNCLFRSTQDNPVTALSAAVNATQELLQAGAVVITGVIRSPHAIAVQPTLVAAGVPMLSPASKASVLSNKTLYPNFFRTAPPDNFQAKALASLWARYGWDHVAILATDDAYGAGLATDLVAELGRLSSNVTVLLNLRYPTYTTDLPLAQMRQIRDSAATIVFLSCVSTDCIAALRAAMAVPLTPSKYQLVSADGMFALDGAWGNASDVALWANGMVGTVPRGGATYLWDAVKTEWARLDRTQYPGPGPNCAAAYDAIMAIATALAGIPFGDAINGTRLMREFRRATFRFNGTTGLVGFDSNQDPLDAAYVVWNLKYESFLTVGVYDSINKLSLTSAVTWSGASSTPPLGKALHLFHLGGMYQTHPLAVNPNPEAESAFRIACEDANTSPQLLVTARARFVCQTYPTYGSASPGPSNVDNVTQQMIVDHVDGIIGASSSVNSLRTQALMVQGGYVVPQISYSSTSTLLSNKSVAPSFLRTCPSDVFQVRALTAIILAYFPACRQVGLLSTTDVYGAGLASGFRASATAANIRVVFDRSYPENCNSNSSAPGCDQLRPTLQELKRSGVAVIVLMTKADPAIPLLQEANYQGLLQYGYVWLGPAGIGSEAANILANNQTQLFQGFLATVPRGAYSPKWNTLVTEWLLKSPTLYPGSVFQTNQLGPFTGESYDAVMAFAYALDRLAATNRTATPGNVLAALKEVSFDGVTGPVSFDASGDRNSSAYLLLNFQANRFVTVGSWSPSEGFRATDVQVLWPPDRVAIPNACSSPIVALYAALPVSGDEVDQWGVAGPNVQALGQELNSAFRIACDAVNSPNVYTGAYLVRLGCGTINTAGTPAASAAAVDAVLRDHIVAGIIGTVRNVHTRELAVHLGPMDIVQISPAATGVAMDDQATYPFLYRTSPSLSTQADFLSRVIRQLSWRKVAILRSDSSDSEDYAWSLGNALTSQNVTVLTTASFPSSMSVVNIDGLVDNALSVIQDTGAAVIILAICTKDRFALADVQRVFLVAETKGMTGAGWTWIVNGAVVAMGQFLFAGLTGRVVQEAMQGTIGLAPRSGFGPLYQQLLDDWRKRDPALYPGNVYTSGSPQMYVAGMFDAVFAVAQALTDLVKRNASAIEAPDLSFQLRQIFETPTFQATGVTGTVAFSSKADPRYPSFDIVNVQGSEFETVGTSDLSNSLRLSNPIIWAGGLMKTPADERPSIVQTLLKPEMQPWVIAVIVIFSLLLVACIVIIVMAVLERQGKGLCTHHKLEEDPLAADLSAARPQ